METDDSSKQIADFKTELSNLKTLIKDEEDKMQRYKVIITWQIIEIVLFVIFINYHRTLNRTDTETNFNQVEKFGDQPLLIYCIISLNMLCKFM